MSRLARTRSASAREDGAVLPLVAVWILVGLIFAVFVIDVGNWFVHQRHLQLEADNAVFAGGQNFQQCFGAGTGDGAIFSAATNYAGLVNTSDTATWPSGTYTATGPSTYNTQIGGNNRGTITAYYQSKSYPPPGGPSDTDTQTTGPCEPPSGSANMFDVKMTEAGLPLFFGHLPGFSSVNLHAHARVSLFEQSSGTPSFPLAPTDTDYSSATVTFTNAAGAELSGCSGTGLVSGCTFTLDSSGCAASPAGGALDMRCRSVTVPMTANALTLMRVGLGSSSATCANTQFTTTQQCYDGSSNTAGLYVLRGVGASPQTTYEVTPTTNCTGSAQSEFFSTIGVNSGSTCAGTVSACLQGVSAPVTATLSDGLNANRNVTLTKTTTACHSTGFIWSTVANAFTLNTGQGVDTITIKNGNGNNATTLATSQFYGGGDPTNSDSIQVVQVTTAASPNTAVSSLPSGSQTFTVNLGYLAYDVQAPCTGGGTGANYHCATDPTVILRSKAVGSGITEAIDCNNGNLRNELQFGCVTQYQVHPGPPYTPICDLVTPVDCASAGGVGNGVSAGQVRQAMQNRFGSGCNNYPNYTQADPRLITMLLTDSSSWNGANGAGTQVPVIHFAAFYVTGWDSGTGGSGSCANEPFPASGGAGSQLGDIWGHFVKYVGSLGGHSTTPCLPTDPTPCVVALTK
jgi:hypothetical protein